MWYKNLNFRYYFDMTRTTQTTYAATLPWVGWARVWVFLVKNREAIEALQNTAAGGIMAFIMGSNAPAELEPYTRGSLKEYGVKILYYKKHNFNLNTQMRAVEYVNIPLNYTCRFYGTNHNQIQNNALCVVHQTSVPAGDSNPVYFRCFSRIFANDLGGDGVLNPVTIA